MMENREDILPSTTPAATRDLPQRRIRRRGVLIGVGALATAGVGGGIWRAYTSVSTFIHDHFPLSTYSGFTGSAGILAWSPDSQHIAFSSDDKTMQVWDVTPVNKVAVG